MGAKIDALDLTRPKPDPDDWGWIGEFPQAPVHSNGYPHYIGRLSRGKSLHWHHESWWIRFLRWVTGIKRPVYFLDYEAPGYRYHRKEDHAA